MEHNHPIQELSAAAADPALRRSILPWAAVCGALWLDADSTYCRDHILREDRVSIKHQVRWCCVVRERLSKLLDDPCRGGMFRHIEVQDPAPVMVDHEPDGEDPDLAIGTVKKSIPVRTSR